MGKKTNKQTNRTAESIVLCTEQCMKQMRRTQETEKSNILCISKIERVIGTDHVKTALDEKCGSTERGD